MTQTRPEDPAETARWGAEKLADRHTVNIDWEHARVDGTVKRLRVWAEGYHFHHGRAILPICGHGATVEDALHRAQAVAASSNVQLGQYCHSSCPQWVAK